MAFLLTFVVAKMSKVAKIKRSFLILVKGNAFFIVIKGWTKVLSNMSSSGSEIYKASKARFRRRTFHEPNLIQIKVGPNHENPAS